ncbi:hypothetical protein PT286_02370 [Neisseriaceae bacterium ESL0693]|nr:hypothetical protein [Neisseriaceae bacterium ESL0693]
MPPAGNKTNGSKKTLGILAVAAIGCVAIAGGAYAYWHSHYDLASKSPKELIHIAIQKGYAFKDNYNFNSEYNIEVRQLVPVSQPQISEDGSFVTTSVMSMQDINLALKMNGAVDYQQQKFELTPSITSKSYQLPISGSLPMLFDFKNMTLVVDPSSFRPLVNNFIQQTMPGKKINSQYFAFTVPSQYYEQLPLKGLVQTLPKAMTEGYDSIDDKNFTKDSADDADGKRFNAKYHIRLNTTQNQSEKMSTVILKSIQTQLTEQAKQVPADKKQNYDQVLNVLNHIDEIQSQTQKQLASAADNALKDMPIVSDVYLDKEGRVVGMHHEFNYQDERGQSLKLNGWIKLDYTQQPQFTIQSNADNTYNVDQNLLANTIMQALPR